MTKVLVIGLDGATLDLVEPWAREGKLPYLASLMERGVYGKLLSVMPVLSSAAWPSFMTGMNPGKHGIFDFVQRDMSNYRLRLVHRNHIHAPSLWRLLNQQGHKVGVINVPMTYPPEEVDGFIVTGLGTPETKTFTYPPTLSQDLLKRGYRVNKRVAYRPGKEIAYINEIHLLTERQIEASLWLMQENPWDFFMTVFFDTDQIAHFFWRYMDTNHPEHNPRESQQFSTAILDYYRLVDGYIGHLIETAGPNTNTIVLSDHGAGPLYQDVFINEWLRQHGFLALEQEVAQYKGYRRFLARLGITRRGTSALLQKTRLGRLEKWLTDNLGDLVFVLPRTQRAEFPASIDWSRTRAYSFGYQGQIYINLKRREARGVVAPGPEYEQLLQEISTNLLKLTDPKDGNPVVDHIYRKEEIFHGPYLHLAPDLTLVMRGLSYITRYGYEHSPRAGQVFSKPTTNESGSHRQTGLLIASGPNVKASGYISQVANLIDLAPTILHLLGCPIPADMDGEVLRDILVTDLDPVIDYKTHIMPDQVELQELTEDEEHELIQRLKSMGYLE